MNEDRWYDGGLHQEEPKILGECPCGEEIVDGYEHIIVDDEYFCDSSCVYEHLVKQHFDVKEIY
jgi:hypothetical protein